MLRWHKNTCLYRNKIIFPLFLSFIILLSLFFQQNYFSVFIYLVKNEENEKKGTHPIAQYHWNFIFLFRLFSIGWLFGPSFYLYNNLYALNILRCNWIVAKLVQIWYFKKHKLKMHIIKLNVYYCIFCISYIHSFF